MEWNGSRLATIGELLDAVTAVGSREEAQRFMAAYRAETEHADSNIGYIAGYCDPGTARRIRDWFGCAHPVFGTRIPSAEEAFAAGMRRAAAQVTEARDG
jgi:hypothetical protein